MEKNITATIDQLIIGKSKAIKNIKKAVEKLVSSKKNLLIEGQRSVGKTTIARAIHYLTSPNSEMKIISPPGVTEQEINEIAGLRSGTIIIREIEELSLLQQALLTKFINEQIRNKSVRIIVTVKEGLKELNSKGKLSNETRKILESFEKIEVPPLDARQEDIPPLVEHFTKTTCDALGMNLKALDINTIDLLSKRLWPENVGELKRVVENAVISAQGETVEIPATILDEHSQIDIIMKRIGERKKFAFDEALENLEKTLIERTLQAMGYNQTRAAKVLGISGANFRYRLRKYQIRRKPAGL